MLFRPLVEPRRGPEGLEVAHRVAVLGPRPHQTPRPKIQSKGRRVDVRGAPQRQVARPAAACRQGRVGRLLRPAAGVRAAIGAVRRTLTDKYT